MNNKILYFECYSGISGDMTVAALLDLGVDEKILKKSLDSLKLDGYKIKIGRTSKCGIDACDFDVILDSDEHHHHSHGQEHGHSHDNHSHEYSHSHHHHGDHEHHHSHGQDEHHHEHRNVNDIYKIIDESGISPRAKTISKKIFNIVAIAESKAHGLPIEEVHFHEVGAVDSIVDIVAVAVCLDQLGIKEVVVSDLYEGKGHVRCQHGIIPVPVPAVVNIAMDNSLSLKITDAKGEMVTPTGAAIVAAIKTQDDLPKSYKINKIGIGAGKKDFEKANILRAFIIEDIDQPKGNEIWVLETNLDDCTGESLGYAMDKLLKEGARDVFYTPIFMKKNRPAYKLSVLCTEDKIKSMEGIIFKNTTSIGIRRYKMDRTVLERKIINKETKYGIVEFKAIKYEDQEFHYPEYEYIKNICEYRNLGFQEVYNELMNTRD
ncbi:MAG: nickel pincer cofactor biosynthesis protein LarC [Tissierella sp.]|nr:nickel pincer cofactor biosynthesis protein LarC [Tissierella sp.]